MNYTKGPWSIELYPATYQGKIGWITATEDSGPAFIVDKDDGIIAVVRCQMHDGFSESAGNARLVTHAPELYEKAGALVQALRGRWGSFPAPDCEEPLLELENLLSAIIGKPVVSSDG